MRFTITRDNLQQGLASVAASIPTRTTLPVLSNILIEADDEGVRMSGTDLDIAVSLHVGAEVEEGGALTVPAKKLQELARELPENPVRITTKGDRFELTCGRASFRLNGLPRDEFPTFPAVDFRESWRIPGEVLGTLIRQTSFAVSTEESRPILNGVLWQLGDEEMRMVATNGHRLALMKQRLETPGAPRADLIVPPKALAQVDRLFGTGEAIEVARSENHLGFRRDGTRVFTRLIEGPYPNYEQVIPKDNDKLVVADKGALIQALRRMAVVASEQTHRVRLSFHAGTVRFSVESPDLGEATEELEVDYQGEPLDIGFNASYLLEVLRYMPTNDVRLSFKAPERAATVTPVAAEGESAPDYLCLVMPLRLLE
ncbi:MAG TPA: DNA polymerase III subunit beta [Longimicrobiales bacterium]|nr:DNA polymerase III subunit beta [Longimicrobiales bacterium]